MDNQLDENLRSALCRYFKDSVIIGEEEMSSAMELATVFINILKSGFRSGKSDFKLVVGEPIKCGSVWEGVKTEDAREFDVIFPLMLNGDSWDCGKLNDYSTSYGPYICYLKNCNYSENDVSILSMFRASNVMDNTLDPVRVKNAFRNRVISILKDSYNPKAENIWKLENTPPTSPAVTLQVWKSYTPDRRISLDLVPCLQIKKQNQDIVLLVPKGDEGLHWRRSYSVQEKELLKNIDGKDNGCRKKVLRLLKTVSSKSKTPLANLDSYILKNAVMNLHEYGDWSKENVADCFRRVLGYLEVCFQKGELPWYFENNYNILRNKAPQVLERTAGFLRNIRERNDYIQLLY